jgi:hypothetical protein
MAVLVEIVACIATTLHYMYVFRWVLIETYRTVQVAGEGLEYGYVPNSRGAGLAQSV